MNFYIRPVAREDILQQFRYYLVEKDSETTAERFLEAVRQAIEEGAFCMGSGMSIQCWRMTKAHSESQYR